MTNKRPLSVLFLALGLAVGCAADLTPEDTSFTDDDGQTWQDLGPARTTSDYAAVLRNRELDPPVFDEVGGGPLDGVRMEGDDGHDYYSDGVDAETLAVRLAAYEATLPEETAPTQPVIEAGDDVAGLLAPQIVGSDNRTRVTNTTSHPFSAIGAYQISFAAGDCPDGSSGACTQTCTGTLISPNHVATSAHCMFDRGSDSWIRGTIGPVRGQVCFASGCITVSNRKFSSTWASSGINRAAHDYAILRLQSNPGVPNMGMSRITSESTLRGLTVRNHGFPGDKPAGQMWGMTSCGITSATSDRITHNCDTVGGHSGGPVYYRTGGGSFFLLGIHSGGRGTLNGAARVAGSDIRAWLVTQMSRI